MSTNPQEIKRRDFAHQCIVALADIKQSLPHTWKEKLEPYKMRIHNYAVKNQIPTTTALHRIIDHIRIQNIETKTIKIEYLFFMAAFCDML